MPRITDFFGRSKPWLGFCSQASGSRGKFLAFFYFLARSTMKTLFRILSQVQIFVRFRNHLASFLSSNFSISTENSNLFFFQFCFSPNIPYETKSTLFLCLKEATCCNFFLFLCLLLMICGSNSVFSQWLLQETDSRLF